MSKADISPTPIRSRRAVLAGIASAAVLPIAAAVPNNAEAAADPIYAAIERHKDMMKAYDAVWLERAKFKDFGEMMEDEKAQLRQLNDATDAAHLPLEAAALDLIDTVPTTQAGIIAALRYIRIQHGKGGEHMVEGWWEDENGERDVDWLDDWLKTLIASVSSLGGKAVA